MADANDGVENVFKWYSAANMEGGISVGGATFEMSREGAEFIEEGPKAQASWSLHGAPSTSPTLGWPTSDECSDGRGHP